MATPPGQAQAVGPAGTYAANSAPGAPMVSGVQPKFQTPQMLAQVLQQMGTHNSGMSQTAQDFSNMRSKQGQI